MKYSADIFALIGFVLVVTGVAKWSTAAALIVAGVIVLFVVHRALTPTKEDRE